MCDYANTNGGEVAGLFQHKIQLYSANKDGNNVLLFTAIMSQVFCNILNGNGYDIQCHQCI